MNSIALTDADLRDLDRGHTINAMAEDGSEHDIDGLALEDASIEDLRRGETVYYGDYLLRSDQF